MEASIAAAKLIEDYKGRKKRFGSQRVAPGPVEVRKRRLRPILLLPLLLIPSLFLLPAKISNGYAASGVSPLPNARIVLTSKDGFVYRAKADEKGDFSISVPEGTYDAALEDGTKGPRGLKIHPGMTFRLVFPGACKTS